MQVKVYGSGSSGNSYTITSSTGETLVLDAGIKPSKIYRDVSPENIAGVLITHSHGDHAAYTNAYLRDFLRVYAPFKCKGVTYTKHGNILQIGTFLVKVLKMQHDVPCVGYLIHHEEIDGDILYATDTNGIHYSFKHLKLAMIEADYSLGILQHNVSSGIIIPSLAWRIQENHNSLVQAAQFCNLVGTLENVMLVHLSNDNAIEDMYIKYFKEETNFIPYIAREGLTLNLKRFSIFG